MLTIGLAYVDDLGVQRLRDIILSIDLPVLIFFVEVVCSLGAVCVPGLPLELHRSGDVGQFLRL